MPEHVVNALVSSEIPLKNGFLTDNILELTIPKGPASNLDVLCFS